MLIHPSLVVFAWEFEAVLHGKAVFNLDFIALLTAFHTSTITFHDHDLDDDDFMIHDVLGTLSIMPTQFRDVFILKGYC